jgi:hypothetical protein
MTIEEKQLIKMAEESGCWQEPKNKTKKELSRCYEANMKVLEALKASFNLGVRLGTRGLGKYISQHASKLLLK